MGIWYAIYLHLCDITSHLAYTTVWYLGERGGSVVECRTPEREVRGSRPTSAVLCPWARHFTPRKYWLITQEAMAPSRHDWKIVDWDVKPQHNQPTVWYSGTWSRIQLCVILAHEKGYIYLYHYDIKSHFCDSTKFCEIFCRMKWDIFIRDIRYHLHDCTNAWYSGTRSRIHLALI